MTQPGKSSSIGRQVRLYRKLNRWSAEELAKRSGPGLSRSIIANLESGRRTELSVSQLMAIAAAMEVSPIVLLLDITDPEASADPAVFPAFPTKVDSTTTGVLTWLEGSLSSAPALHSKNASTKLMRIQRELGAAAEQTLALRIQVLEGEIEMRTRGELVPDFASLPDEQKLESELGRTFFLWEKAAANEKEKRVTLMELAKALGPLRG